MSFGHLTPHTGSGSDLTACLLGFSHPTDRTLSQFQAVSSGVMYKLWEILYMRLGTCKFIAHLWAYGCRGRICTFVLSGMSRTDYCFPTLRYRLLVSQSPAGCFPLAGAWGVMSAAKPSRCDVAKASLGDFPFPPTRLGTCPYRYNL